MALSMSHSKRYDYYLGIGSNSNRRKNMQSCLNYFLNSFAICHVSPVYRSASYGFEGHDFFNSVIHIQSAFEPAALKIWVQHIEDLHGRDRSKPRYSNRTLDIDLLLCDDLIIDDGTIQVPRREILKRKYVLKPLQDLAPDLIHPVAQKRLADLWQALSVSDAAELISVDNFNQN
jgi:2-amino-4-hydroxy-6-hydroxymethyldihydropteridine diphosphokinase